MWIDGRGSSVLDRPECLRLLALASEAGSVGHLAFSLPDAGQPPVVLPVNFRFRAGEIVLRLGAGLMSESTEGHLVAFEVDRVDRSAGDAWSVLVRGLARLVDPPQERRSMMAAEPLVPEPGDLVLTVRPDVVTGRRFNLARSTVRAAPASP